MSEPICNTCSEYIDGDCICSEELQSYDHDIYAGGDIEFNDWSY